MHVIPPHRRRVIAVRSIIGHLKQQKLRPRDLDSPNGEAAIAAIISLISTVELQATTPPLGKTWEMIAARAVQYSGSGAYR
jgi:hypothetical protein